MRAIDLTGNVFGSLTVISFYGKTRESGGRSKRLWTCMCECGNEKILSVNELTSGNTTSCGCRINSIKHGMWKDRFYQIWSDMKMRCRNKESPSYKYYGGKGVTYSEDWEDFLNFKNDMYPTYSDELTLDRIDVNGDYTKDNCRWVTMDKQLRNRGMYSNNTSGVTGVHEWTDSKTGTTYYVSSWKDNGKNSSKYFSIKKHGEELAFFMACEFREQMIALLNLAGAGYGENHGKPKEFK